MPTPTAPAEGKTTNTTKFANPDLELLSRRPTTRDHTGIERVAGPHIVAFTPARTEASAEEKAHLEAFNQAYEDSVEKRHALVAPNTLVEDGAGTQLDGSSTPGSDPSGDAAANVGGGTETKTEV